MNTLTHVGNLFAFIGGLGMFLYGMDIMASGLQKTAGNKMKDLLGYLTNNRILGVLVGALVTAIIQSSSATTVMVVGFVNAGIMNLTQAAGVIMGANVGTTITAWLVSANEWAGKVPSDLPIYNIGGDQDPVGEYGKGIYEVTNWLVDTGHTVKTRVYSGYRHEIHNYDEIKDEVEAGIISFMDSILDE